MGVEVGVGRASLLGRLLAEPGGGVHRRTAHPLERHPDPLAAPASPAHEGPPLQLLERPAAGPGVRLLEAAAELGVLGKPPEEGDRLGGGGGEVDAAYPAPPLWARPPRGPSPSRKARLSTPGRGEPAPPAEAESGVVLVRALLGAPCPEQG